MKPFKYLSERGLVLSLALCVLIITSGSPAQGAALDGSSGARSPQISNIPAGYSLEFVDVKFREGSVVRLRAGRWTGLSSAASAQLASVLQRYPIVDVKPLFTVPEQKLNDLRGNGMRRTGKAVPDLNLWFRFHLKSGTDADGFIRAMRGVSLVEKVEAAALPSPPPVTPNFQGNQGYLNAATDGIDALYAWTLTGGTGSSVRIADVEYSWNQTHEDLSKVHGLAFLLNGGDSSVDPFADNNHGTAVLGEIISDNNGIGVTGISYGANIALAPANTANLG
jgi:serine protease